MDETPTEPDQLALYMTADPETWLPQIVLAVYVTPEELRDNSVGVCFAPEDCFRIGAMFIQMAQTADDLTEELVDRSVEDRKEILTLEHLLASPPAP